MLVRSLEELFRTINRVRGIFRVSCAPDGSTFGMLVSDLHEDLDGQLASLAYFAVSHASGSAATALAGAFFFVLRLRLAAFFLVAFGFGVILLSLTGAQ